MSRAARAPRLRSRTTIALGFLAAAVLSASAATAAEPPRLLRVGDELRPGERLQTEGRGAYLLFPDGSALSVADGANLSLDAFDFDGEGGRIALSAERGLFRFVGGAVSKTGEVELRTPLAVIDIEGGVALIDVGETVSAGFLFGRAMTVRDEQGRIERATRPGAQIDVTAERGAGPPAPISTRLLASLRRLEAAERPAAPPITDDDVAASQIAQGNSFGAPGDVASIAPAAPPPSPAAAVERVAAEASREQTTTEAFARACSQDGENAACAGRPTGGARGGTGGGAGSSDGAGAGGGSTGSGSGAGAVSISNLGGGSGFTAVLIFNLGGASGSFGSGLAAPSPGRFAIGGTAVLGPTTSAPRTTRALAGFAAGLESRYAGGLRIGTQRLSSSADPADVTIATSVEQDRVTALFKLAADADGEAVEPSFDTAPPGFGSFVDDSAFFATTPNAFAPPGAGPRMSVFTTPTLHGQANLPDGVAFCTCDYALWGLFRGDRPAGDGQLRDIEVGAWVAGELADFQSQLTAFPQNMTASYSGHVVAGVNNNGAIYGAVGGVNLKFTFGPGAFTLDDVSIVNFDGANLQRSGAVTQSFVGNGYGTAGNFTVAGAHPTAGQITAELAGAFFGPGSPPQDTGGKIEFRGANYEAHGIFAAAQP